MKKLFILLLIIPILGFSQNDLVFNRVLNFKLNANETVTVPAGKAWKVENQSSTSLFISNDNPPYGSAVDISSAFTYITSRNATWLAAGSVLQAASGAGNFSILEFNVVAASTSTGSSSSSSGGGFSSSTPGDDFTDQSGNSFNSTNTGDLTWSTSNASHTTYRDGTPIPQITNKEDWNSATTGAWCYLHYDETNASYGKLYNYFAVVGENDSDPNTIPKIFGPSGWHVPAFAEWNNLMNTNTETAPVISGTNISYWTGIGLGGKMKSQTGWNSGFNGTNSSGLNIKPYGYMSVGEDIPISEGYYPTQTNPEDYSYQDVGSMTVFWTKDRINNNNAYAIAFGYEPGPYFILNASGYSNGRVYNWNGTIHDGLPADTSLSPVNAALYVRLVKDY
jgi:uncharacterized protein (TIGR02145 family)